MRGREAERRVVRELLGRAQRGTGGVLLLEGESGTGKSLLLRHTEHLAAAQGFSLAIGKADELGQIVPFFALLTALNEPFDDVAGQERPDTPGWWIARLRARLEERVVAAPVLVCLDDLQWADPETLLALRMLPRKLARYPLAWVLARTKTQQDRHGNLLFSFLERDGATRITPPPLCEETVAGVLTDAFGAPPDHGLLELASGAAGNPELLAELIGGLRDEDAVQLTGGRARLTSSRRPHRIDQVARRRLEGLSGPARHLLQTAAVLGRSFRLEDAAAMLGETPAGLLPMAEEAADARIVTAAEDVFWFRHELMWRAVAEMIPPPARKALHRQFGELLLKRGGSASSAAAHLLEGAHAGDLAALTGLDRAAAETLQTSPQTAARLALRALELTSRAAPDAVSRAVAAAEALTAAGRVDEAAGIAHDALAQPLQAAPEARLRCVLSSIRCLSGQAGSAIGDAQEVLAQPELPRALREHSVSAYLQAAAGMRGNQTVDRVAAGILAAPDEHGRPAVAAAHVTRALVSWDEGRISEALELLRQAAHHGTGVSPDARDVQPLLVLAACLVDLRLLEEAAAVLRAADTETLHGIPSQAVPGILRARIHLAMGRSSDAASEGRKALEAAQATAAHGCTSVAHSLLGLVALRGGDLRAAASHLASRSVQMPHFADAYARTAATLAEAQITEARHGPAAVIGQIRDTCADLPARRGMLLGDPATVAWLVRTALTADDPELAAKIAATTDTLARENPRFRAITAAATHSLGLLHRDPERLAQAAKQHDDPWARASAAEDLGVLLASQTDKDLAIRHLDDALDGYQRADATIDTARIRRRLRRLGVRRRHWASGAGRPVSGWASLTETEQATSELVAQGLTNQQIADRMYISVHTIAVHLRRIFSKLGIRSRVELTLIVFAQVKQPEAC
jgi:DNA-binding CsgD family transcriptional regulator